MSDTSKILVAAARDALLEARVRRNGPMITEVAAAIATAAILRQLAILMNTAEIAEIAQSPSPVGVDWPLASDLVQLANDVEESL